MRKIDGVLLGNYQGLIPGPGSEPGESREYELGDDVRLMDWSVTARTAVPHVRQPIADRELETWILVDLSPSIDVGSHVDAEGNVSTKRDLALAATATYGFLSSTAGNRVGAVLLGAGDEPVIVPPGSGRDHVRGILERVAKTPSVVIHEGRGARADSAAEENDAQRDLDRAAGDAGKAGDAPEGERDGQASGIGERLRNGWSEARRRFRAARRYSEPAEAAPSALSRGAASLRGLARRRGLVVLVSDFLEESDWERAMRIVSSRQQMVAVRLTDPLDVALPQVGRITLRDAASDELVEVDVTAEQAATYAYAAARHRTEVVTALRHCGAPVLSLRTDRDWVRDVIEFAGLRRKGAFPDGERALADLVEVRQ